VLTDARTQHCYQTCRQKDCQRFGCRVYREGYHDGYENGSAAAVVMVGVAVVGPVAFIALRLHPGRQDTPLVAYHPCTAEAVPVALRATARDRAAGGTALALPRRQRGGRGRGHTATAGRVNLRLRRCVEHARHGYQTMFPDPRGRPHSKAGE
jgi:hypothetical protein